jgi:type IV pilus assembly protein PilY1
MNIADWGGHFSRYVLSAGVGTTSTLAWDAGAILTGAPGRAPEPRRSVARSTLHGATGWRAGRGALHMAHAVAAQQALLSLEDDLGEQRVAYLRGDRSLEGMPFRRRSSILGDAVHSTPVYVDTPDHRAAIYLGANDGMLHAFDAVSGIELFAYVPDALIAQLHHLTDPAYIHRAYVDGPASAGAANIAGSKKTILLSAMGGGARGVRAGRHRSGALRRWPRCAVGIHQPRRSADGQPHHRPADRQVRVRRDVYRDFAIVASGINNGGNGALFLLALDKPRDEGWRLNRNYYRIQTPVTDALSAPALLNDGDGVLRYAYAGDLQGNLWRFDFSDSAPWAKAVSKPLFIARDASGRRQPITQPPLLAYASQGYFILFGTGRLIELADRKPSPQSYYAIIDSLQTPPDIITGRHQLTQRFLDGSDLRMEPGSKGWFSTSLKRSNAASIPAC